MFVFAFNNPHEFMSTVYLYLFSCVWTHALTHSPELLSEVYAYAIILEAAMEGSGKTGSF